MAANVVPNGTFDTDLSSWVHTNQQNRGTRAWDNVIYGAAPGSFRYQTETGRRLTFEGYDVTPLLSTISATDTVYLSFYWYKYANAANSSINDLAFLIILPDGSTEVELWSDTQTPNAGQVLSGTVGPIDVSNLFTDTGTYQLKIAGTVRGGNDGTAYTQFNVDDIVLDVRSAANAPPVISAGATQVSVSPVNRFGANTTTISATFSDSDSPGIGAFNVTFKIREPNNSTELTLVNAQPHGSGGLTITDNGGGSYTAQYDYNPDDAQALGLYDLYCEVTDGTDNDIDGYANNNDELEINEVLPNNPPVIAAGATQVSVSPVNRFGSNTTTISTDFTDSDVPGIGAFNVTFKIQEPNNSTELTLVNAQPHGSGGLTITDNGGGSYTAQYTYDPGAAQTLGLYDLYCEVTDGTDNDIDDYANNLDELEINEILPNNPPVIAAGATQVSVSPVNRLGANTTTISATFTDSDDPGIGAFNVTFKIQEPNNSTELTLVNAQPHGAGGLTITDNGGGSYTAQYDYNPDDAQTLGLYDLYCEVTDGTDNDIDDYANNLDELEINEVVGNNPPVIPAGATQVSVSPVNRVGTNTTTISATFSDSDQPGIGAFNVTFRIREPNNTTELTLVNAQPHGAGGLTITDNGGGSYTAQYDYNPDDAQTLGLYDLYCEVTDGTDNDIDDYANNTDELEINEVVGNNPPVIPAGATQVSISPVNRVGSNTTAISATFSDSDQPGIGAFNVTFRIREPNNTTELTLVNAQPHGAGGLTITDNGGGSYTAQYDYNPDDAQTLGLYDLYCEVTDGTDNDIDNYVNNADELEINDVPANNPPVIVDSTTAVFPGSLDRLGSGTTEFSVPFTDSDGPGVGAFQVTFIAREPYTSRQHIAADALQNGQNGMTISDDGGNSYTARFDWDPPDTLALGYYDLYSLVSDGTDQDVDDFIHNPNELLITSGGENNPPIVPADNTVASPAALERIGANSTVLSATFTDSDQPGVGAFTVSFKLRTPDNVGEIVLASGVGHGSGGVTISDDGGGIYTASISWDPPDAQELGYYDLYFDVSDGSASAFDNYVNNLDELQIFDAISNNTPTLVSGNTFALPTSITRLGTEFTMIKSAFADADEPGPGAFSITVKVRDESNTEYTLINAAQNGEQGLQVRHLIGPNYEASMLWDPPAGQVTGTYDLFFEVTDGEPATATDGYANNADELTITATAVAGDGNLLRRNNDANTCGGPNSACHNMADHQAQDCRVCHVPHGSSNIFMVRETIQTPNSGPKSVLFKTLGIGDPDNDPDPVAGDPNSGVMADDTDGVFTNVCEVCHTSTTHHRNDGSHPPPAHNNALDCTGCHPHTDGFAASGGGESSGGVGCTCHSSIFNPMNSSTSTYHHFMSSNDADYTISSKTCLMCHVDHDIFRPDLNTGIGQRAKNLRVDITSAISQGDAAVLANYDYTSSGTGGICLSCHTSVQTKGYTHPDGSTQTIAISKTDFDAATSSHNYAVTSTFSSDGSSFSGTCVKCHNDETTKSYQGAGTKFATHDSNYRRFLDPLGLASPTDPLEEDFCARCHSTTNNPNAGSNQDYYGVKTMSTAALRVEQTLSLTYAHPVTTYRGRHDDYGETAGDLADGATRHAECGDCHNTHAAAQGTHDGSSNLVSNALKGVWGVEPTSWPAAPAATNANAFAAPSSYDRVEPAQKEYQICLKCHSNYTTLPSGARNLAEEINPNYQSTHGIVQAGTNPFCNTTTMNEPWGTSKIAYCSDCHRSSNSADPEGPHGSNLEHLLVETVVSDDVAGTPLCMVCHSSAVYWTTDSSPSNYPKHPSTQGAHKVSHGCFACHMWEFSTDPGVGINSTNSLSSGNIYVHGMNKRFTLNEQDGSAGTGQDSDAFVDGYLENMDFTGRNCWAETCKSHSNKAY